MPVQGPQQPGFYLPGAEYFSLSPNTNIAIQGRRRKLFVSNTITAPASTNNVNVTGNTGLEFNFTPTSGIYLHAFWCIANVSADGLSLNNAFAGLSMQAAPSPGDYPLGIPIITTTQLFISTVVLSDRDKLITQKDLLTTNPIGTALSFVANLNVDNTQAAGIQIFISAGLIWTRLDGILE